MSHTRPPTRRELSRRDFLRAVPLSASAVVGLSMAACGDAGVAARPPGPVEPGVVEPSPVNGEFRVTDFLPANYVKDGSVAYRRQIERAIRRAAGSGVPLRFAPMEYLVDSEMGVELLSDLTLLMEGAVFRTTRSFEQDGQVFRGYGVRNLHLRGGEIVGERASWRDSVNVAGIRIYGESSDVLIEDLLVRDVSSNGVGIFGVDNRRMARNITLRRVRALRCCNVYIDYSQPNMGPVEGSTMEDQGEVAMYFARDFRVEECVLEDSRADATHFYRCENGEIVKNQILRSKMGGYFIEACTNVNGRENFVRESGSRGVSLEYGTVGCTFDGNVVEHSGREGCWANDVVDTKITNNTFREDGRKNEHDVSCGILLSDTSWPNPNSPRSRNVLIAGNRVYTTESQWAAIRIASCATGVVVQGNYLGGARRVIRAEAWMTGVGQVIVRENDGWRTENGGVAVFSGNGAQRVFTFAHGLDVGDARIKVYPTVTGDSSDASGAMSVAYTMTSLRVTFASPPRAGVDNVRLRWAATVGAPSL